MFRTVASRIVSRVCLQQTAAHSRHLNRTIAPMKIAPVMIINFVRMKHVTSGIQGIRNSKQKAHAKKRIDSDEDDESTDLMDDPATDDLNLQDK